MVQDSPCQADVSTVDQGRPLDLVSAFEQAWPAAQWQDLHVVLAVSGGADSAALLRAALSIKDRVGGRGQLYVAHLNHGLRGRDADDDERWLHALCRRLGVPLEIGRADVAAVAADQGDGWECAARTARYDFLRTTAERLGARYVAVGHTADDQVETVLQRIVRGTGVAGLAGMPATRALSTTVSLVRPLLGVRRREVFEYLRALGQDFRHDATNDDRRFTRNRLRHEFLPQLRALSPDVDRMLLRLAEQAGQWQEVVSRAAAALVDRCVHVGRPHAARENQHRGAIEAAEVRIDCRPLVGQPPLVIGEVGKLAWTAAGWPLQDMGFDQWQQLARMVVDRMVAPLSFPGGVRGARSDDTVYLRRAAAEA